MTNHIPKQENIIEPASYLWHKFLVENQIPREGIVIEVAPGYEPKIGNALALLGFSGTIFLIEPDQKAACHIQNIYQQILPRASVKTVNKLLQSVEVGINIPYGADALLASHPFDDVVMAFIAGRTSFFSQEKEGGQDLSPSLKKLYDALKHKDYIDGIKNTTETWKHFIKKSRPDYFIASQYPSHMLTIKGLSLRQESGFVVLKQLKSFYQKSLSEYCQKRSFGYKGNPKWWIVAKKP